MKFKFKNITKLYLILGVLCANAHASASAAATAGIYEEGTQITLTEFERMVAEEQPIPENTEIVIDVSMDPSLLMNALTYDADTTSYKTVLSIALI